MPSHQPPSRALQEAKRVSPFFWIFLNLKIGALSFGSSARVVLYQDACVEQFGWITNDDFQQILTFAQILPGPNLVNVSSYLGYQLCGFWAAVAGVVALALPGGLLAVAVIWFADFSVAWQRNLFQGFSLGSISVCFVFIWTLMKGMRKQIKVDARKTFRLILRFTLMVLIAGLGFANVPLLVILAIGCALGPLIEFLI